MVLTKAFSPEVQILVFSNVRVHVGVPNVSLLQFSLSSLPSTVFTSSGNAFQTTEIQNWLAYVNYIVYVTERGGGFNIEMRYSIK